MLSILKLVRNKFNCHYTCWSDGDTEG